MTHGSLWWAKEAITLIETGTSTAVVSIVATAGSAPRDAGTRMLVSDAHIIGTIGGGNLEFQLIQQARRLLQHADTSLLQQDYPLGPLLSQCCGGRVRVLVERLDRQSLPWLERLAAFADAGEQCTLQGHIADGRIARSVRAGWSGRVTAGVDLVGSDRKPAGMRAAWASVTERINPFLPDLYLFGAGHVGIAIARIARTLPFHLIWVDPRPDLTTECDLSELQRRDPLDIVQGARRGSYFLVMTHSHHLDYAITRTVLTRSDAAFCGLIGSVTKRARFVSRLKMENIQTSQLVCPIGTGAIRNKDPACIAVSISADLLVRLEASQQLADRRLSAESPSCLNDV